MLLVVMLLMLLVVKDSLCHHVALLVADFIVVAAGAAAASVGVACAAVLRPDMKAVCMAFTGRGRFILWSIVILACRNLVDEDKKYGETHLTKKW